MERGKYEQQSGNLRYKCASCGKAAIHSARLPLESYTCPIKQDIVTVEEIRLAQKLSDVYGPKQGKGK